MITLELCQLVYDVQTTDLNIIIIRVLEKN